MAKFDWQEYLKLAKDLQKHSRDEAKLRSAVSRAYYAAFGTALERSSAHGVSIGPVSGFNQHQACWMAYQAKSGKTQLGNDGDRLKGWRVMADYDASNVDNKGSPVNWERQAELALTLAEDLLARLQAN